MRKYLPSLQAVLGVLCLLIGLGAAPSAQAATTTLTFEGYVDGDSITTQYQGVGVTVTGGFILDAIFSPWPANTGTNLLGSSFGLMTFTVNTAITGNIQTASAYLSGLSTIGLYAYDAGGLLVGQALAPGAPNNVLVSVTSTGNPIASVQIHDSGSSFAIDTLSFVSGPVTVPFASFAPMLVIDTGRRLHTDSFGFSSPLTLGTNGKVFDPATDTVTLQIGSHTTSIPAGSFKPNRFGGFVFKGVIDGVSVLADIQPQSAGKYWVGMAGTGANLMGVVNPVPVVLSIGTNTGSQSVTAAKKVQDIFKNPFKR